MAASAVVGYLKAVFQLDTKEAEASAGKIEKAFGSKVSGALEGMASKAGVLGQTLSALGPVGLAAGAAIGVVSSFTIAATKTFIDQSDKLDDLANRYAIARVSLDAWGEAAKASGVTVDQLGESAKKMSLNITAGSDTFTRLGLSLSALQKMSIEEQFETVGARILELTTDTEQNAAAAEVFGKSWGDAMQALRGGMLDGLPAAKAWAESMDTSRGKAAEMADKFTALGQQWERFKSSIAQNVGLPILDAIGSFFLSLQGGGLAAEGAGGGGIALPGGITNLGSLGGPTGKVDKGSLKGGPPTFITKEKAAEMQKAWEAAMKKMESSSIEFSRRHEEGLLEVAGAQDDVLKKYEDLITEEAKAAEEATTLNVPVRQLNDLLGHQVVAAQKTTKELFNWKGLLQGVTLLAGAIGGKFGEVLGVFENIGREVEGLVANWDEMGENERISAIANIGGLLGGAVGGTAGAALTGAGGGAAAGAAIGGPIGAVIGGVVGLFGGIFGNAKKKAEELKKKQDEAIQSFQGLYEQWTEARKELADVGAKGVNKLTASLLDENGKLVEGLTTVANAAEYVGASFAMLRASGMTTAQALATLKPALDVLTQADPEALKGTAAEPLVAMANYAAANEGLLNFISGLGETANALAGFGLLTQDLATKISIDMGGAIQKMIDDGLGYNQALALSAQDLYNLKEAAEKSGVTLDEHTQKLIADAEAAGLFEGLRDPMDKLVEINHALLTATGELVKLFGGALPASVQKLIDEFNNAQVDPGGGSSGGDGAPPNEPMASGAVVTKPTRALVGEAGTEVVAPVASLFGRLADEIAGRVGGQNVYIMMDPNGGGRVMSAAESRRMQSAFNTGAVKVSGGRVNPQSRGRR